MENKPEIGKIYDSIFFCIKYFNAGTINDSVSATYIDIQFMEDCYQEIKANISALPSILSPFFHSHNQNPNAITSFFSERIDFEEDTLDIFICKISEASDILFSKVYNNIFQDEQIAEIQIISPHVVPISYITALSDLNYPDDFKLQIALLFGNFNYAINLLIDTLRTVYKQVEALHHKHLNKLQYAFAQIRSERNIAFFHKLYSIDLLSNSEPTLATISLLNQGIVKIILKKEKIELLLGIQYYKDLSFRFDNQNIDLKELLIALGNNTRLSIIQHLWEGEDQTAASLSKNLRLPPTTVLRHVEILYKSGIVFISKKCGLQVFYQLDRSLLKKAAELCINRIGGTSNEGQEKNKKTN